jgi:hypothetical protein
VQVVVAGRSVFKIYSIEDEGFVERENLRVGKNINLNYRYTTCIFYLAGQGREATIQKDQGFATV